MKFRDPDGAMDVWLEGWQELQDNLPGEVDTVDGAQEAFGMDFPTVQNWVWDVLNTGRGLVARDNAKAARVAGFVEDILARFDAEPGDFRRSWEAELAYFLGCAGRIEAAEKICRRHITEHPEEAQGYCTLADVYLEAEPVQPRRALEMLEEAAEYPATDPRDWDLSRRIEYARRQVHMKEARESGHFVEWDAFWDAFEKTDLDKKLEMARERIDNAPDFDEEWVFTLMIEGLMQPCRNKRRGGDWIELLEYLREKRPVYVKPESGVLGAHAVEFALADDCEYLEQALELLFLDPADAVDHIFDTLELLAYCGVTQVRDHLVEHWPAFRNAGGMMPSAYFEWADWAMRAQIAAWADEDLDRARTLGDVEGALGDMMEKLDPERVDAFTTLFLGPKLAGLDATKAAELGDVEPDVALGFTFARSLIDDQGWSSFKALLAGTYLIGFARQLAECDDPFQSEYSTKQASQSKLFRRELKELRELWREDFKFAPHPDLAVGYAEAVANQGVFGSPYTAAAIFEAVVRLAPWLEERGLVETPELTEMIQRHFSRRIAEVAERWLFMAGNHPRLKQGLEHTEQWLNSSV